MWTNWTAGVRGKGPGEWWQGNHRVGDCVILNVNASFINVLEIKGNIGKQFSLPFGYDTLQSEPCPAF